MISLFIDTSDNQEIKVQLEINGEKKNYARKVNRKVELTLDLIEESLKTNGLNINQIDKIYVKRGPGSFTGLRIGISIANALSFALGKSVNNKEVGTTEDAIYS